VCEAQQYLQEGRRWVVDVDLEKFFDRVNHDVLMGRLAKRIADRRMLGLIRRYLDAGIMANGVVVERHEGTPQGGPLSTLLANVLLDEVDKELEKRGHAFVRYADDCNVYVRSRRAGERVMETLRRLFAKLRLRINESKSAVARPWDRKFLGYSFWVAPGREVKRRVASKALEAMKQRVRSPHGTEPRPKHSDGHRGAPRLPRGVEGVLPPRRHAEDLSRAGRMDTPPTAHDSAQTVEAGKDDLSRTTRSGSARGRRREGRRPRTKLVEKLGHGGPHRHAREPFRRPRPRESSWWRSSTV
jgi:hypothetical protein